MSHPFRANRAPLSLLRLFAAAFLTCLVLGGCSGEQKSEAKSPAAPPAQATEARPAAGVLAPGEPPTSVPVEADDAVWGNAEAPVTLVAFLDFECRFCARGWQTLRELQKAYGPERLRIVVKHLPLDFHQHALPAAIAAQAVRDLAGNQAFFAYGDRLMENQSALSATQLAAFAEEVGVDRELYNERVVDETTVLSVVGDVKLTQRLGVDGTPSFFINGRSLGGAQPVDTFRELIDAEEKAVLDAMRQGQPWAQIYTERVEENLKGSLSEQLLAEDPDTYRVPVDGSPVWGGDEALVTLVEFSDFECPYCKRAHPTVQQLKQKYGDQLRVVFKHLPLPFHDRALPAARIADAVYRQKGAGAFWQTAEALFGGEDLSDDALLRVATKAGLTPQQAREALDGESSNARIERDTDLADDVKARGTPHFFINGKRLTGARPLSHFEAIIDAELARAQQMVADGTAPNAVYETLMKSAVSPDEPQKITAPVSDEGRPSRGPKGAPIVVHVFSDFECPFCRRAEVTVRGLEAAYPGQVRVVWHNFPLEFHDRARPAARAALEAYAQGGNAAFWKMHDLLFGLRAEGPALEREEILGHARTLGLDVKGFEKALDGDAHEAEIQSDEAMAEALDIRGTPAFVIGSYLVVGAQPLRHFERIADRVLEESKQKP